MKQAKQEDRDVMADFLRGHANRPPNEQKVPQAQWMDINEIKTSKLLAYDPINPVEKVLIGRLDQQLIGIADNRHIMTVAGSRSGKSVGLISNLLFYPGSILATDPKGELAINTVKHRAALGQKIRIVDPFGTVPDHIAKKNYRASFNPMAILDPKNETFLEDAALIAESIVTQSADQRDPHWDDSARNFIEGVIIHVATAWQYESKRHLVTVRELLKKALLAPPANDNEPSKTQKPQLYHEMLENAALLQNEEDTESISNSLYGATYDFYNKTGGELSSVHSTVNRHTKFLDYKAFRNVLRKSDFNLADLKRDPSGVSVYLCFPATRANMAKRWMRIFVNQLLDAMEREKTKPAAPVLACLDEFPVLDHMPQLETAAGLIASFDVKLWVILQDWSQGKALYGERWETFAGNAGILQFFGNNDLTTCEYISQRLGKTQVEVTQFNEVSLEQKSQGFTGKSTEIQLHDLLTPDEIMRLFARHDGLRRQLIFLAGRHPMVLQRVEYYREGDPVNILVNSKA